MGGREVATISGLPFPSLLSQRETVATIYSVLPPPSSHQHNVVGYYTQGYCTVRVVSLSVRMCNGRARWEVEGLQRGAAMMA